MIRKLYKDEKKYQCANSRIYKYTFEINDEKKIKRKFQFFAEIYTKKSENAVTQRRSTRYVVILK